MSRQVFLSALLGVLAVACSCASAGQDLPNPFARPAAARSAASARAAVQPQEPADLELRATLVRGRDSSANIGGRILRVGEKMGGYRLVSVREGAAVLVDASGVSYVLEIEPSRQVAP
jgi:hypothetical protein